VDILHGPVVGQAAGRLSSQLTDCIVLPLPVRCGQRRCHCCMDVASFVSVIHSMHYRAVRHSPLVLLGAQLGLALAASAPSHSTRLSRRVSSFAAELGST
jgi:surfactin synthase thioesterase subunit